jgi:carbonic anhydrase
MEAVMDFLETLARRNADYAEHDFAAGLRMLPSQRTMIIGCVDPLVDPMDILKLEPGEAAVIRNIGGRINPAVFETMAILGVVSRAAGQPAGAGWNLIVLHHTDCGIVGCHHHAPGLLAKYMCVAEDQLEALAIADPYQAVAIDVAALKGNPNLPGGFMVTGMVYDVATGRIETVVAPALLRPESA